MKVDSLIIENLHKSIGEVKVLSGISTRLHAGGITAFIGPNGAGKTTFFHAITGDLEPDRGRIIFEGREITRRAPWEIARMGIGKMFQDVRIFPSLTVLENILAGLHRWRSRGLWQALRRTGGEEEKRIRVKAENLLAKVGVEGRWNEPAGNLSWGNQKLLAFARLLAGDFRLVLLDEPVAGVSPALTGSLKGLIRELADSGVIVALIEHDMAFVRDLAHDVVVLNEGRVFDQGPVPDVLDRPATIELCLGL